MGAKLELRLYKTKVKKLFIVPNDSVSTLIQYSFLPFFFTLPYLDFPRIT